MHDHQHQTQDSRQSFSEQIYEHYRRQLEAERQLEHEEAKRQGSFSDSR